MQADTLIADKAFDANECVLMPLAAAGKAAVIPPRASRTVARSYDRHLFKARHLIENFFGRLKQFRAIATRYDKTRRNFLAAIQLASAAIWLCRRTLPAVASRSPLVEPRWSRALRLNSAGARQILREVSRAPQSCHNLIRGCQA